LSGSQVTYEFDQADDWAYLLGDGGSHFYCTTNAFFDNVLLMHTKQIILSLVDTFGESKVPFPLGDALYNQFGADKLQEALAASGGDFDEFWAYLFPPEAPGAPPAPQLSLVSVAATGNTVVLTVANTGDAPCTGEAIVTAGLACSTSWIPEWCTVFSKQDLGQLFLAPEASTTLTFDLPPLPQEALTAFRARLETVWTGYKDTDPNDYIGLTLSVSSGGQVFGFLALP